MEKKIREHIEKLEHDLEHAEKHKEEALKNAQRQAEMQIANLEGRLTQRADDIAHELDWLRELVEPASSVE